MAAISGVLERCSICLSQFEEAAPSVPLNCSHLYHRACIEQWAAIRPACPLCQQRITSVGGKPVNAIAYPGSRELENEISLAIEAQDFARIDALTQRDGFLLYRPQRSRLAAMAARGNDERILVAILRSGTLLPDSIGSLLRVCAMKGYSQAINWILVEYPVSRMRRLHLATLAISAGNATAAVKLIGNRDLENALSFAAFLALLALDANVSK